MDVRVGLERKLSTKELMLLKCGVGEDSWESLDSKEIQPVHPNGNQSWMSLEGLMLKLNINTLATWCKELTHLKRPWYWERLKVGGEGDNRGWHGWMASPTQWTWVWINSGSWWWTGRPGMLQSMGSQRVDVTEQLNWTELIWARFSQMNKLLYCHFKGKGTLLESGLLTFYSFQ